MHVDLLDGVAEMFGDLLDSIVDQLAEDIDEFHAGRICTRLCVYHACIEAALLVEHRDVEREPPSCFPHPFVAVEGRPANN